MKRTLIFLLLALFALTTPVFAAPNTVMVLFNGNTEVNRHVYNFLTQALGSSAGGGYKVVATLDPSTIKPGVYKAVVVVSTKTTAGVDPVLAAFMKGYTAPKELYLVSLLSRTSSLAVTTAVDAVTAATTWSRNAQPMHAQWMQAVVTALGAK